MPLYLSSTDNLGTVTPGINLFCHELLGITAGQRFIIENLSLGKQKGVLRKPSQLGH